MQLYSYTSPRIFLISFQTANVKVNRESTTLHANRYRPRSRHYQANGRLMLTLKKVRVVGERRSEEQRAISYEGRFCDVSYNPVKSCLVSKKQNCHDSLADSRSSRYRVYHFLMKRRKHLSLQLHPPSDGYKRGTNCEICSSVCVTRAALACSRHCSKTDRRPVSRRRVYWSDR